MKTQTKEILALVAIVAASAALGVRSARYHQKKEKERAEEAKFLKNSATLIEKSEPYHWGTITRDLYLDLDGNLNSTEAIVRIGRLNEKTALNAAVRDMTNGTKKALAEWQKFGHLQTVK